MEFLCMHTFGPFVKTEETRDNWFITLNSDLNAKVEF